MATIKEHVDRFILNSRFTEWDHEIAEKWLKSTRCGRYDISVLAGSNRSENEKRQYKRLVKATISFARQYFDDRPNVVRSLDLLLAELGVDDESERRSSFLPFGKLYRHDEVMVLLLKHLQPTPGRERYSQEDIAEYFLTTDRTIREYMRELRPAVDDELNARVLGQIVRMDTSRGTNVPESTTHPLFLPFNMLELYTLVDMLVEHANDEVEGRIVRSILKNVLDQTTGYAQERLNRIEGLDKALSPSELHNEQQSLGEAIMFREKEASCATVIYEEDGVEKSCTGIVSRAQGNKKRIDITDGNRITQIRYRDIIRIEAANK